MPDDRQPPDFVVRVVVLLLVALIATPIIVIFGRGLSCLLRGAICPFDEVTYALEQLSSYLATMIALLMALLNRKD